MTKRQYHRQRRLRILRAALYVFSAIFIGLLLIEGLVRFAPFFLPSGIRPEVQQFRMAHAPPPILIPDPDLGDALSASLDIETPFNSLEPPHRIRHIPLPGQSTIGYRANPEDALQPSVHIAAVGDSHVYGMEVDQNSTWTSQLARLSGLRTANLGLPFQGTSQELKLYELYGYRLHPKVVLFAVCPNDAWDNEVYGSWQSELRGGDSKGGIYHFTDYKQCKLWGLSPAICGVASFCFRNSYVLSHFVSNHLFLYCYFKETGRALRAPEGLRSIEQDIRTMKSLAEGAGAKFGVILTDIWGTPIYHDGYLKIRKILGARHIPFLDLTATFDGMTPRRRELVTADDTHWSDKGHAIVAREVYRFLVKENFIQPAIRKRHP